MPSRSTEIPRPLRRVPALVYALAVTATLVTLQLRLAIDPVVGDPSLLVFMVPIVLSAYLGGFGPGLVAATVAAVVSAYFLLPPERSFTIARMFDYLQLAILVIGGGMVSALSSSLRHDRRQVQESEERLQTILENLSEGLIVADEQAQIVHWNRAGLEMHGLTDLADVLYSLARFREIFELSTLGGTVVPFEEWPLQRILRGEHLRNLDLRIRRLDIAWERVFSYGGTTVPEPGGRRLAILTVTDITDRTQLEAQLLQTQKMESIGRLAGGVAHDFNNWLTVITGCTELIGEMLPPNPVAAQLVAEMRHAGERATSLTRQLLAFSRREVVEPRVVDLNAVVADTEKMLRRILGEDVLLSSKLDPSISRVRIDAGQWIQVLMNLAVNARDAMPQGGRLTIETAEVVLDGDYIKTHPNVARGRYVMLAVSDTGCGMSPEVKARIFDPFFTTKPRGEGTGLGLAVVHGIVEQSGGHVGVYSEPSVGTTFKLYLPPVDAGADSATGPDAVARLRGSETILLVEDDDSVRRVTSRILRRYGYTILEAASGDAALQLLEEEHQRVALLLTDVVMPNMNGRQLAERVMSKYPSIKVLYTSGYTEDAVVRHGVLHAEVAFIQKPHTASMLAAKIREVLDGGPPAVGASGH